MTILICPGVHPPELTQCFLNGLGRQPGQDLVFPADRYPAYSAYHIWRFLQEHLQKQRSQQAAKDILLIGFSAGVVGAIGAAPLWQGLGGTIKALIALDGWGVPLIGNFPIYRISHDPFTHWSSNCLGGNKEGFYADPPVAHLELWRSPQRTRGWWLVAENNSLLPTGTHFRQASTYTTATLFLRHLLQRHQEI